MTVGVVELIRAAIILYMQLCVLEVDLCPVGNEALLMVANLITSIFVYVVCVIYIICSTGNTAGTASTSTGIGIGALFYHQFFKKRKDVNATAT